MLTHFTTTSSIGSTEYSLPANSTTLTAQTELCVLEGWIRSVSMAPGDLFRVRLYETVNGSGQLLFAEWYLDAQQPHLVLPAFIVKEGWNITVQKLTGGDRTFHWDLKKHTVALQETLSSVSVGTSEYSIPGNTTTSVPTSQTADCLSQLWVRGASLAVGDIFRVRRYDDVNGTKIVASEHYITAWRPTLVLPLVTLDVAWDATLLKSAGTDRSLHFAHRRVQV